MARVYKSAKRKPLIVLWDTETLGFGGAAISSQHCYILDKNIENEPVLFEGYDCIENTMQSIKQTWLDNDKPLIRLYAHNAAFDLMRTKEQLENSTFKAVLVSGQMIAGKLLYDGMEIECRDSLRMLPESLSNLSASLAPHLPKLQLNHLIGYIQGDIDHQEYAKRDVVALRAIMLKFSELIELPIEDLKYSTAGQAFKLFKTGYEKTVQKYHPLKVELNKIFLKHYYYGGRIYIRHNHNPLELCTAVSLDITSSYPYQMLVQSFPYPGIAPRFSKYIPDIKCRFFVHVKVRNYSEKLAILPLREFNTDGTAKSTIYPNGTFESCISDLEYNFLKKHQASTDIEIISCYFWPDKDCDTWLKPYIDLYYNLKALGDKLNAENPGSGDALRTAAKLLLNALYGKFAQKYIDGDGETVNWNGGETLEIFGESNHDHRNAHISAFITGGARVHLYDAIMYYGISNVIYCDTDSIKVYKHIYDSLPKMPLEGEALGGWKPEGVYTDLQVIAPKVYIGNHTEKGKTKLEVKAKGLPLSGIHEIILAGKSITIKRSKTDIEQNKKADLKAMAIIADAAKTLLPIEVLYSAKPVKLKSFIKNGVMAQRTSKTLSYPETVKGMDYTGNVYRIKTV